MKRQTNNKINELLDKINDRLNKDEFSLSLDTRHKRLSLKYGRKLSSAVYFKDGCESELIKFLGTIRRAVYDSDNEIGSIRIWRGSGLKNEADGRLNLMISRNCCHEIPILDGNGVKQPKASKNKRKNI